MEKLDAIFLIGPQGSGKGTQAKFLAEKLKFFYWEMGGILREMAKTETDLGKKIKSLIDKGQLLSDEELFEVVDKKLKSLPAGQGVIFDGIPRSTPQAEKLLEFLKQQGRKNFVTLYISLPESESLARLLKRAEIEKRADDAEDKIKYRLDQYKNRTLPVLEHLKANTVFYEIDGTPSIETVRQAINHSLGL